jgi:hypothetical protein
MRSIKTSSAHAVMVDPHLALVLEAVNNTECNVAKIDLGGRGVDSAAFETVHVKQVREHTAGALCVRFDPSDDVKGFFLRELVVTLVQHRSEAADRAERCA